MLNDFGKISAAEVVFYSPVLCISFFVALRYGFRRQEGWVSLLLFSTVRIVGAVLSIISKTESNPSNGLLTAVGILQALGLSPLLLATLGFVGKIADYGLPSLSRILRVIRLVLTIGVVMAVVGGTKISPNNSPSSQSSGHTYLKVGTMCFVASYVALSAIHMLLWGAKRAIPPNHRKLLMSLTFSLPFLAVRVLYSVLGAFVPSPSQWSSTTGNWKIYLVMALIMEYIVVCTYVITGAVVPLHEEEKEKYIAPPTSLDDRLVEMGNRRYGFPDH